MPEPVQGEVWWVSFDPAEGSETKKSRPGVVISSDRFNHVPLRIVAPFTTWQERFNHQKNKVRIDSNGENGLEVDSAADVLQLRSVSVERFRVRVGVLDRESLSRSREASVLAMEESP